MRIGPLRHKITIQRPSQTQDPQTGAMVSGWEDVADVWARVEPASAREFIESQAAQSKISGKITIRYRQGLSADMRALHRGKVYNIEGVLPDNRSGLEWITMPVSEGVNDGE